MSWSPGLAPEVRTSLPWGRERERETGRACSQPVDAVPLQLQPQSPSPPAELTGRRTQEMFRERCIVISARSALQAGRVPGEDARRRSCESICIHPRETFLSSLTAATRVTRQLFNDEFFARHVLTEIFRSSIDTFRTHAVFHYSRIDGRPQARGKTCDFPITDPVSRSTRGRFPSLARGTLACGTIVVT